MEGPFRWLYYAINHFIFHPTDKVLTAISFGLSYVLGYKGRIRITLGMDLNCLLISLTHNII